MRFRDRTHAGLLLAAELSSFARCPNVVVLAIPRGGVVVGFEVALQLHTPLDVFIVRKIGAEHMPELAVGAIASGGAQLIDERMVRAVKMTPESVERAIARERAELERREIAYREARPPVDVRGMTVLLVDDGIATGATMRVAIAALRLRNPAEIVVAVPVVDASVVPLLADEADDVVAVTQPSHLEAVGQWYLNFEQTLDHEVTDLLRSSQALLGGEL